MKLEIPKLEASLKAQLPSLKQEVMSFFHSEEFTPYQEMYALTSTINPNLPLAEIEAMLGDPERFQYLRETIGFRFQLRHRNEDTSQEEVLTMIAQRNRLVDQLIEDRVDSELVKFDCFDTVLKPKAKVRAYLAKRGELFNAKAWRQYIIELYKLHYPQYTSHSKEGVFQFLLELKEGYLGFEIDFSNLQDQVKRGNLTLPRKKDIIWLSKPFAADKQILGELDFATNAAFPSAEDYYITKKIDRSNGMISIKTFVQQTPKGDKVLLHGNEDFGQKIIQYAYLHSEWTSRFNTMYLEFLRSGINEI